MNWLTTWFKELFRQYHVLHLNINGVHCNVYIDSSIGSYLPKMRRQNPKAVLVGAWRITSREYQLLKRS